MLLSTLFSLPDDLCLVDVLLENEELILVLRSSQTSAACPQCAQPSTHIHGHYTRWLADLPCLGRIVRVHLHVRRFACRTRGCSRTTFAERFPQLARPYGRRTLRQAGALKEAASALGGKAGARLATRFSLPTSRETLLRSIRSSTPPLRKTPRVLGLDDFAWKKGDRYGTLLVDLEAHAPVDVLPDREADTVACWLRAHRGVKLISRDRAGTYAQGAKRGAPRARQIADRYHILVNLRDALKGALARHQATLPLVEGVREVPPRSSPDAIQLPEDSAVLEQAPQPHEHADAPLEEQSPATPARRLTAAQRRRQVSRANRYARYEQVLALHRQGLSQRDIAKPCIALLRRRAFQNAL